MQKLLARFWTKTRYATQYAFGSNPKSKDASTAKQKSATGSKPISRRGLSGHAGAMGNVGSTRGTATHVRSTVVREDDEIEMVPNHPYIAGSEERAGGSDDLEAGGIRVQKDWYVTKEKAVGSSNV